MFEELKDKVCLVTGATGGIGKSAAHMLGKMGMKVFITDVNNEIIKTVIEEFKAEGIVCAGTACDVTDEQSVEAMVSECEKTLGAPYSLVNCAGIYKDALFKEMTFEQWQQTININLNGVYHCVKAASRLMIREGRGNVVSLTSQAGISGSILHAHYSASKAGIIGLTVTLAREFAEYGIRVNCVAPGIITTAMTADCIEKRGDKFMSNIILKRFGTTDEVANVILFLTSDMSSYMTGQTINVTGGWLLHS